MSALAEAATSSPRDPGVYFFLGPERDLLYVGKAADLHRRLGDHARAAGRTPDFRRRVLLDAVRSVHWEVCDSEESAAAREADLIVMLGPAYNASHSDQDPDHYVVVTLGPHDVSLHLGSTTESGRAYGTFPHLARGASSHVAKRTKVGYTALLRLLWSAGSSAPCPSRIAGSSPPARFEAALAPESRALLHDFLSGRRARLLPALQAAIARADIPAFTRSALSNDFGAAREFFELGPARVRRFRLRHALPPGPVPAGQMANLLAQEVRDAIGDFQPGAPCPDAALLGRRGARQRQLRDRLRG